MIVWYVCLFRLLTPALFEEPGLIAPNQQIYGLYKSKSIEKKDIVESIFLISVNYPLNVIKIAAVRI